MGSFDSVMVPCPICGTRSEFQSKSGPCLCYTYNMETAPDDVLWNVNRHAPNTCEKCGCLFQVELRFIAASVIYTPPELDAFEGEY